MKRIGKGKYPEDEVIAKCDNLFDLRKAQYMAGHRWVGLRDDYKGQVLDALQADVKKFQPFCLAG
jgi:hypothetical protein